MNTHAVMRGASALAFTIMISTGVRADADGARDNVRAIETPADAPDAGGTPTTSQGIKTTLRPKADKLPAAAHSTGGGVILTQTGSVRIGCFPSDLRGVLTRISSHFGRAVVVTSGHRGGGRRGSFHRTCRAADIQIAGVAPSAIARLARGMEDVGGVGTYGHTRSVHVDVGERIFSWHGGRRRTASLGSGCCPDCASAAAGRGPARFEAVCTS